MKIKQFDMNKKITVGVFSSSLPISATVPSRYERGVAYLESKGFCVVNGSLYQKSDNYRSGTVSERADEFNQLLYNKNIDILMAAIGGNNTNSILPYIDYAYLKQHPKMIIGYSDTTALLLGIYAKTGLTTFYGPSVASSFGEFSPFVDWTFDYFYRMLHESNYPHNYEMPPIWTEEYIDWKSQNRGKEQTPNNWVCVKKAVYKVV